MAEIAGSVDSLRADPNFLLILLGAICWLIGFYIILIGPLFTTLGFAVACYAAAATALSRPVANAFPGLLLGLILHIAGTYLASIPLFQLFSPFLIVSGGVLILFFAIPLALQLGNEPILNAIEKIWKVRGRQDNYQKTDSP